MRGLETKRVLITGGASGIGAPTAVRFLEEGSVVCVLDRDAEGCKKLAAELPDLAGALCADVTDLKQVQTAFAEAIKLMGGVDVLINNAGGNRGTLPNSLYYFEQSVNVNYEARNSYQIAPYNRLDLSATYTPDRNKQLEKK